MSRMPRVRAEELVTAYLADHFGPRGMEVVVTGMTEKDVGWVAWYQSRQYLEGDESMKLEGNGPLLVDLAGRVRLTGTGRPIDDLLADMRDSLPRDADA